MWRTLFKYWIGRKQKIEIKKKLKEYCMFLWFMNLNEMDKNHDSEASDVKQVSEVEIINNIYNVDK